MYIFELKLNDFLFFGGFLSFLKGKNNFIKTMEKKENFSLCISFARKKKQFAQ